MASPRLLAAPSLPLLGELARGADRVRHGLWRWAAHTSLGRRCARDRATRVAVLAAVQILVSLALTLVAPLWLLLVGPLVLGVPHAVSDVRFLLLRPSRPLGRAQAIAVLVPLAAMTALRLARFAGAPVYLEVEGLLGAAAIAGAVALARTSALARAGGMGAALVLAAVAVGEPQVLAVVLGHVHNFVAVGLWLAWLPRGSARAALPVVALLVAGMAALALGAGDAHLAAAPAAGLSLDDLVVTLAPGLPPTLALRLVLTYAFAQSVHYALWVRVIPETLAPGAPAPTWRRSLGALQADLGRHGLVAALVVAAVVAAAGLVAPADTRNAYLSLVLFHGWLELAMAARLLVDRAPRRATAVSP